MRRRFHQGHNRRRHVLSEAERAEISEKLRGQIQSAETRAKRGAKMRGSRNPNWRGDDVGYDGVHIWVRQNKPRSGICEFCGAQPEPLRDGRVATEFANISGEYRRDVDDYWELCRPCHDQYDEVAG